MADLSNPEGHWVINRHVDEKSGKVNYAFTFNFDTESDLEHLLQAKKTAERQLQELPPDPVPSEWPVPDLSKVSIQGQACVRTHLMFIQAQDLNLISDDDRWSIRKLPATKTILAEGTEIIDSRLSLSDLKVPDRGAVLDLFEGVLTLKPINPDIPTKVKYWDNETLRSIIQNKQGAFKWWEYD